MKKIIVAILVLFVVVNFVIAQDYEVIDQGEIEGFFSYVSIATEDPSTAFGFISDWATDEEDNWFILSTDDVDKIFGGAIDSREVFDTELSGRIGVYLYLYTEANVRISMIYENGDLYFTSDSPEVMESLKNNKDVLLKGLFNI